MKKILTIAGSDCSGGAGIQADIKTITMHGMYAMSAITALTAQNTTGVYGIMNSSADFLKNQIDCIFNDIRPDAVKIGMVSDVEIIGGNSAKAERIQGCEYSSRSCNGSDQRQPSYQRGRYRRTYDKASSSCGYYHAESCGG